MRDVIIFPSMDYGWQEIRYSIDALDPASTILICKEEYAREFPPKDNFIVDKMEDATVTIQKIESWLEKHDAKVKGVLFLDDNEHFRFSKNIAKHFNVDHYSDETLDIASNKYLMKKSFHDNRIPTTNFELVDTPSTRIGFPNILKVLTSNGSEYIFRSDDPGSFRSNFFKMQKLTAQAHDSRLDPHGGFDPRRQFLVEGFAAGTEYSCDFMFDKRAKVIRIAKKYNSEMLGYFSGFSLLSRSSFEKSGITLDQLESVCGKVARSLNIDKGVCMLDFFVDSGNINVIETNIRPGFSTFVPLMKMLYGTTSLQILAEMKLGISSAVHLMDKEGMVIHIFAKSGGRITKIDHSRLKEQKGYIGSYFYNGVGEVLTDSEKSHWELLVGYVYLDNENRNEEDIEKIFKSVYSRITLEIKN